MIFLIMGNNNNYVNSYFIRKKTTCVTFSSLSSYIKLHAHAHWWSEKIAQTQLPVMLSAKLMSSTVRFLRASDRRLHVTCCVHRSIANIARKQDTLSSRCCLLMLVRTEWLRPRAIPRLNQWGLALSCSFSYTCCRSLIVKACKTTTINRVSFGGWGCPLGNTYQRKLKRNTIEGFWWTLFLIGQVVMTSWGHATNPLDTCMSPHLISYMYSPCQNVRMIMI